MKKFKIGLLGPNNKNKLRIIDRLTSIDLSNILKNMEDNAIYTLNHYKVYIFSKEILNPEFIKIVSDNMLDEEKNELLYELNNMDLNSAFQFINTYDFIENVQRIYLALPIKKDIELNNIYSSIVVYDNRGFLEGEMLQKDIIKKNERVNRIIFSALDFTKNADKYLEATSQLNTIKTPFIIRDTLEKKNKEELFKNNVLKNAEYSLLKELDKYFKHYVVL